MKTSFRYLLPFLTFIVPNVIFSQQLKQAEPYGGKYQLKQFIKEEMVYPEQSYSDKIKGTVGISLQISESGEVNRIKVYQSVNEELDKEALRIIKKILWEPASYMGANVVDQQTVTIKFDPKKYDRICKERGYKDIIYPFTPVDLSNKIYKPDEIDKIPTLVFNEESMTLSRFITKNIQYPQEAKQYNISGTETVEFIVEPSGHTSNLRAVNYIGAGCCEETMRLIKLLKWYPGIHDDKAVRVRMSISITFNLSNDSQLKVVPSYLNSSMQ